MTRFNDGRHQLTDSEGMDRFVGWSTMYAKDSPEVPIRITYRAGRVSETDSTLPYQQSGHSFFKEQTRTGFCSRSTDRKRYDGLAREIGYSMAIDHQ